LYPVIFANGRTFLHLLDAGELFFYGDGHDGPAGIQQSAKYNYVVNSYLKNVPSGQRFGITVWGVDDPESWIILSQGQQDAPLLFDRNFARKPAYAGFLQG
jgi:GH35 family endo-1,4-beta-xylanase